MLLGQISYVAAAHDISDSDVDSKSASYQVRDMLLMQKLDTLIGSPVGGGENYMEYSPPQALRKFVKGDAASHIFAGRSCRVGGDTA